MNSIILIIQIIISLALITTILLQAKGAGLGTAFGGAAEQFRSKRGVEKILFRGTIVLVALFLITSIVNLLINK